MGKCASLGKSAINPQKKQYLGDILLIDGAFNLKTENIEKTKLLFGDIDSNCDNYSYNCIVLFNQEKDDIK
jgi:hypothetical protein